MSSKILLAKASLSGELKVIGIGKCTMPTGEGGKGREGINNYELSNLPIVMFLSLYKITQHSVASRLLWT